nr:MAG TPA: hypothetical protein [Caudoviricetes sp.]
MHSPLVPVHVPMDLQGHFLNILLSEKENILSLVFVPRITRTFSIKLSILSLFLSLIKNRYYQGHFRLFVPCP